MHRHHRHPVELNASRLATLSTRKLVWSRDEDSTLLRHANNTCRKEMMKKEHLALLKQYFPNRCLEAVKERLQHLG